MKTVATISLFLLFFGNSHAQTCVHTNLSEKFDYIIMRVSTEKKGTDGQHHYAKIIVQVIDKSTKKSVQIINLDALYLLESAYQNCNAVKSYLTGTNKGYKGAEGDDSDFIVADFNFDGREDLAIKSDSGGGSGPVYVFYVQNEQSQFNKDDFLTEQVSYLPWDINPKTKTLTTLVMATYTQNHKSVFKYNPETKRWAQTKNTFMKF